MSNTGSAPAYTSSGTASVRVSRYHARNVCTCLGAFAGSCDQVMSRTHGTQRSALASPSRAGVRWGFGHSPHVHAGSSCTEKPAPALIFSTRDTYGSSATAALASAVWYVACSAAAPASSVGPSQSALSACVCGVPPSHTARRALELPALAHTTRKSSALVPLAPAV